MADVGKLRADHEAIAAIVPQGARVLDVGCGNGDLLQLLRERKQVDARGLELSSELAGLALARGLSVIQGDADSDLEVFPDDGFDVSILSKAIQQMRRPDFVLEELSRIAPDVVVSFRNYGLWSRRLSLLQSGRMPGHRVWHDEAALHPSTARDMIELCRELGLETVAMAPVNAGKVGTFRENGLSRLNWAADEVILHLRRA
ncbi:MAG: methionine biosynthesis protein MetW [Henriciella sp.]|uniref:methionine biosynthesis protein MetW n=1 Tax=Henriciella sp. TaxID=1968823 RepID=UPI003C76B9DF